MGLYRTVETSSRANTQTQKHSRGRGEKVPVKIKPKLPRAKVHQLILENREHGRRLAWSFLTSWRIRMNHDEVMSVVGMALCEAANRFDARKGVAFRTFFFYHLRGMLLKEIARLIEEQKLLQVIPESAVNGATGRDHAYVPKEISALVDYNNPERLLQRSQLSHFCWEGCAQLDPLEQEILVRYFVYDEPLITIAKELKYCRCHVSRVKSRALSKLHKLLAGNVKVYYDYLTSTSGAELAEKRMAIVRKRRKPYTGGRGRRRTKVSFSRGEQVRKVLTAAG